MAGKILVTGGAGYIGSFMVRQLAEKNYEVVVLDNLSYGHIEAVIGYRLQVIDLVSEKDKLNKLFEEEHFDAVIHMASFIQMGESYVNPSKYYFNNVVGFLNLMEAMRKGNCKKIVLSSSAGVYGNPERLPIEENDLKNPLNPYGETKYMMERILEDYDSAYGIKFVALRYFNAAGAALDGSIGEAHSEESHLIPNIITKAIKGQEIEIFGEDYETLDGTCIRDYVHVLDLVVAHSLSLEFLEKGKSEVFNLGLSKGYSNKEIINIVEKVSNLKVKIKYGPRREGDANSLYAGNEKIKKFLGWIPKYNLEDIVKSSFIWHNTHPNGYKNI
ncbi:UDP-glucose 4-epimerase GalE [Candidatus Woesebacteria bacterium GWC2_33_12]|uniref:UDP-glucose 4-epimerase n=1 Tax=Candidatus Woesebacteria bacterium GW2011_GWB1_33_22 TaxID=1618566 RepID=A0A0F9ZYM3_9BACT|nr:MAG: UDP-glucose 4-epimerase [Candidatus Woesebacteria bacterium GW2011_GWC2_33_12]KKP41583.1 MAG: UDP-glucose 4-epimerase [Candidatus Woesebacteria bacterium GW2011_GWA2_33_20]KKP44071.1 MAG: UDP-glucose 4-epimerase [Candidatus Woesebacteria bacterium GW2011_GWB1_33_22]KKP45731.1 MAG: UDP-glucose 4-epimerase [Microgenomates group bacterium GW2011_GWC1_33_28]KKP49593.1 MAG: UDP-glucose 4-epimerase [Candidatus Woesebacteria bacterium GW2011_GWA1_33_33]OGM07060.1 MAG: UDP-glucose 4-epimerase 